jgi:hypothetical protein
MLMMRRPSVLRLLLLPLLSSLWMVVGPAQAITADELLLKELAWAETRIRMFRHGFGSLSFSSSSEQESVVVDADALMAGQIQDQNRVGAGGDSTWEGVAAQHESWDVRSRRHLRASPC